MGRRALEGHNLGCHGQNLRLRMAVVVLAVALASAILFVKGDFPVWARAFCFVPFLFAGSLAFQGLFRTCPMHARQQTREDDAGYVDRAWGAEVKEARHLSMLVIGLTFGVAGAATGSLFLLP